MVKISSFWKKTEMNREFFLKTKK